MKTYHIFLASSAELKADRVAFEQFINRENKRLKDKNVFLSLEIWEDSGEAMSQTRSQDEYNKLLKICDIFVMLYWTKVGMYTREEYDLARAQFLSGDLPKKIYVYHRTTPMSKALSDADNQSLKNFADELQRIEFFAVQYDSAEALQLHFGTRLRDLFAEGTLPYGETAECLRDAGKAAVPTNFIGRDDELREIRQRLTEGGRLILINAEGGMGKTTVAARYWDQNLSQYRHNAWLFCEKGIVEEIKGLAPALGIDLAQLSDEQQIEAIRRAFNNMAREQDCLLVLDNANNPEHIRAFQQAFGGLNWHILITSRCSSVVENEYLIQHLPPDVAKKLFTDLYSLESGPEFDRLLDQFLKAIGYNTLAIEIFAKNLKKAAVYHNETLIDLIGRLDKQGLLLEEKSFKIKTSYLQTRHIGPIGNDATTDQIIEVLYDLSQLTEDERFWLVNLSLLPAVSHEVRLLGKLFDTDVADLCEKHLEPLAQKGWLNTDIQSYRVSPVVQNIVLFKNKNRVRRDSKKLIHDIVLLLKIDHTHYENINFADALIYSEIAHNITFKVNDYSTEIAELIYTTGQSFKVHGYIDKSISCFQRCLLIDRKNKDYANLANSYMSLGEIMVDRGEFTIGFDYYQKSERIFKDFL